MARGDKSYWNNQLQGDLCSLPRQEHSRPFMVMVSQVWPPPDSLHAIVSLSPPPWHGRSFLNSITPPCWQWRHVRKTSQKVKLACLPGVQDVEDSEEPQPHAHPAPGSHQCTPKESPGKKFSVLQVRNEDFNTVNLGANPSSTLG